MRLPTRVQMVNARALHQDEGTCEIDDNAKLSRAKDNDDAGAYVQAWVWVPDETAQRMPRKLDPSPKL